MHLSVALISWLRWVVCFHKIAPWRNSSLKAIITPKMDLGNEENSKGLMEISHRTYLHKR